MVTYFAKAQELKGTITNKDGEPLEAVSITNGSNDTYAISNASGYFELENISVGDEISMYSLGYENKTLVLSESDLNSQLKIVLIEAAVSLDQVVLVSKVNALSSFVNLDIETEPIKSAQEVLRKVPGLIIGQHAGGGKAEQIFLRGFDVDHGTDIAINVDGLPVNLVSHAHGQGYSDLHFIIPETIDNIDFGKGPYYANQGNFNTAGYIGLKTRESIDQSYLSLEAGQFDTLRALGLFKLADADEHKAYLASELVLTDGVFESPQNFNRFNIMGRYHFNNYEDQKLTLTLSHFQSRWTASGQVPVRAIESGLINRFGAIDDTEGGDTGRSNVLLNHTKIFNEDASLTSKAYASLYDFELFSNFTFFLVNPEQGDQIVQRENRFLAGAESVYNRSFDIGKSDKLDFKVGAGFRYDDVNDLELSRTQNRTTLLQRLSYGEVDETNAYGFFDFTYRKNKWTLNPGLRLDYFRFSQNDFLANTPAELTENQFFVGPKLNAIYAPSPVVQLFAKSGIGFHSNDTRVVTTNVTERTLPGAFGADVGTILKPINRLAINATAWTLLLQQEFVYVGDEAIVEPSGRTRRFGLDLGFRYQATDWLFFNGDVNLTNARSLEDPSGSNFIPLAPDFTSSGGVTINGLKNFSGGLSYRFIDDRPANEDNSIVAEGYFVTDMNVNYNFKKWTLGIVVENLFNVDWNETQFATESRLFNEAASVEEIHFTPGTPFFLRGKISFRL